MLYLTGRRILSRKLLIFNFLGSVGMCASGQNYRGGFFGFMEKKLKLRNSQKDVLYSTRRNPKSLK